MSNLNNVMKEFKAFILKGNIIDMAVGVIIGGAFSKIVTSLVNDILMPVLGALTGDMGFDGADIGKITVHPAHVYVAIRQNMAQKAYKQLQNGKIKGKSCRVRLLK